MLIYVDNIVVASSLEKVVDVLLHDLGLGFEGVGIFALLFWY
jgi:hypothetical protein